MVEYKLEGSCAIAAIPFVGKNPINITFDGITSSAFNANLDENYFAMLDLLKVDLRGWVNHLLAGVELPAANWDIDIKAMIDAHRSEMTPDHFGYSTGGHHALREQLTTEIKCALFNLEVPGEPKLKTWEAQHQARFDDLVARLKTLSDPEMDEYLALRVERKEIVEQDSTSPNPAEDYLFGIAQQVLLTRAEALDTQWLEDHGIPEDQLVIATSSSVNPNLERFPQLAEDPQYRSWIEGLTMEDACDYEWGNPAHLAPTIAPGLISYKALSEVLNNCNFDGNAVIAFEADLDDLDKIAEGLAGNTDKDITVSGAYFHIHDYGNGAGDGAELDGDWTFSTADIKAKRVRLENDTCDSFGIQATFSEFLASGSSVKIRNSVPPEEAAPAAQASTSDSPSP